MECTTFSEIVKVPDPKMCGSQFDVVFDSDVTHFDNTVDVATSGPPAYLLSGFIGNVAQANDENEQDSLRIFEQTGKLRLVQRHKKPLAPLKLGPLTGESSSNGCVAWTPDYAAKNVHSTSDVQLVPFPQSRDVRCFITGITGAWSNTRSGETLQPHAEIYSGSAKDVRLRVFPADAADRVSAYASCIRLK